MTPITTVKQMQNLRSGDYVGYYSSASDAKDVAIAKVVVEPDHIVLEQMMSFETFVLPNRVHSSDSLENVFIPMTSAKWAELGLLGDYPDVNKRNPNPEEKIFILTEDEVMGHVVIPNI